MKKHNLEKEQYRGTIKQYMKVLDLRKISISNYIKTGLMNPELDVYPVATLKYNIQDGYLNMFDEHNNKIDNETAANLYKNVYHTVLDILQNESLIPYKQRRNILVKVNR